MGAIAPRPQPLSSMCRCTRLPIGARQANSMGCNAPRGPWWVTLPPEIIAALRKPRRQYKPPAKATGAGAHPGGTAGLATSAPTHSGLGREHGVLRARAIAGAALAAPPAVGSRETGARHTG